MLGIREVFNERVNLEQYIQGAKKSSQTDIRAKTIPGPRDSKRQRPEREQSVTLLEEQPGGQCGVRVMQSCRRWTLNGGGGSGWNHKER